MGPYIDLGSLAGVQSLDYAVCLNPYSDYVMTQDMGNMGKVECSVASYKSAAIAKWLQMFILANKLSTF